jgi:hypothetical protein
MRQAVESDVRGFFVATHLFAAGPLPLPFPASCVALSAFVARSTLRYLSALANELLTHILDALICCGARGAVFDDGDVGRVWSPFRCFAVQIDRDERKLASLQKSIHRGQELTDQMNGILSSFDTRISGLENVIRSVLALLDFVWCVRWWSIVGVLFVSASVA